MLVVLCTISLLYSKTSGGGLVFDVGLGISPWVLRSVDQSIRRTRMQSQRLVDKLNIENKVSSQTEGLAVVVQKKLIE